MSKSVKAKMNKQLATESQQIRPPRIHKICAAMEVLVYRAEKITRSKRTQFEVRLKSARQAAIKWSHANHESAIERLEREIHQKPPVKHKMFHKLFQHHE